MKTTPPWIIKPLVPEETYTDRAEFLEYFYQSARKAATRRTLSTVLLGRRRMGKTEIFKRVVNRLFFEQDPHDPLAVVPVYYSFSDEAQNRREFAADYLENFIRHYVAFYTLQPELILSRKKGDTLLVAVEKARSLYPFTRMLDILLEWHDSIVNHDIVYPEQTALESPRRVADIDDSTIVVFLDEFQNTRLDNFDVVGWMQEAVESPNCPHFVTGSALSILAREIIGRGSLFGRFHSKPIETLSNYWGAELAKRTARYYQADLPELMAPIVATRCGGNPFYITAVIRQAVEQQTPLRDEEAINKILAVDLSSGFIWAELHQQVTGWIERINEYGITKWILYLSALEEDERISLERIQRELKRHERKDVSLEQIHDILVRLSRGDLLEYLELGRWFRKIDDPILLEFLKIWGRIEVEGRNAYEVQSDLAIRYRRLKRQIDEYKGYMAEVFMSQVLLNSQQKDKLPLPGHFFNSPEDIPMPWSVFYARHRVRLRSGEGQEIDLLASVGGDIWVCQSKWVTTEKIGLAILEELLAQGEAVREDRDMIALRLWLFAYKGLTDDALKLAEAEGILWSNRIQLDNLLAYLGLRKLPNL